MGAYDEAFLAQINQLTADQKDAAQINFGPVAEKVAKELIFHLQKYFGNMMFTMMGERESVLEQVAELVKHATSAAAVTAISNRILAALGEGGNAAATILLRLRSELVATSAA
jgi:hypothetical protein